MRIPRFYYPEPLQTGQALILPPTLFRHAIQVLRLKKDETLVLFNGQGGEFYCTVTHIAKREAWLQVEHYDPVERESPLQLTLVQSIIKPDKMDFAIQKSVELGVNTIQPLISQRSVVRPGHQTLTKKQQHWQAVAISACEQSGRTRLPLIQPALPLDTYLQQSQNRQRLLLAPGNDLKPAVPDFNTAAALDYLIGPEGGFSMQEVEQCTRQGIQAVNLGSRVLRAETAALVMAALLQYQRGDLS